MFCQIFNLNDKYVDQQNFNLHVLVLLQASIKIHVGAINLIITDHTNYF